jgi:hypothetical protein
MQIRTESNLSSRQFVGWPTCSIIAAWLAAIAFSYFSLMRYQFATIDVSPSGVIERWPSGSKLPQRPDHSTLVLFLHPKCPCSRATLSELERLFTSIEGRTIGKLDFVVDATVPANPGDDWLNTATLERAKTIPGAQIFIDRGGIEAATFGATTSGFVMLFDENNARRYAGGVTESRGHEGDSAGSRDLARILCGEVNITESIPAFGCRLCLPENQSRMKAASDSGAT